MRKCALNEIDFSAFVKYSKSGPRYTSYPTAVEFQPTWNNASYMKALESANASSLPLSLYVHLPFCRSACYYCGCNVIYTSKEEKKQRYIAYLRKEIALLADMIDVSREVVQFHFGGGTPTFFNAKELESVITLVRGAFKHFATNAEISCEIDPRFFTKTQMAVLKDYGFNRLSFGVQDFDEKVQEAIHRKQHIDIVRDAVAMARDFGIHSINFDLIYGLPFQNEKSFAQTLEKVVALNPDRLAIFNYAHVPWIKKTMRNIDETTLPNPAQKLEILKNTIAFLQSHHYAMIGMDHFAKQSDELYLAKCKNQLRRNFQGYTTRGFSQTVGIGLTSISEGADFYSQNYKDMKQYEAALDNGKLPVERGVALDSEDILRKEVIMGLMNNLCLDFTDIERKFHIDFRTHFAKSLESLREYEAAGLVSITPHGISTSHTGGMLIRNIAMAFDAYLAEDATSQSKRFSKTI